MALVAPAPFRSAERIAPEIEENMNELISTESSESVRLAEAAARAAEADAERAKAEARIAEAKARTETSSRRLQIIGALIFFALFFSTMVLVHMTKSGVFN